MNDLNPDFTEIENKILTGVFNLMVLKMNDEAKEACQDSLNNILSNRTKLTADGDIDVEFLMANGSDTNILLYNISVIIDQSM